MPGQFISEVIIDKMFVKYSFFIVIHFLIILLSLNSWATFKNKDKYPNIFPSTHEDCSIIFTNSDIFMMYSGKGQDYNRKYNEDVIAWGGQLAPPYQKEIEKRKKIISSSYQKGIRYHAVDLPLLQEGGKFLLIEGGMSPIEANSFFYNKLRKNNKMALLQLKHLDISLKEIVVNIDGVPIGVPWLAKRFFIPMPCIQNDSVRNWYKEQIVRLMSTGANVLHFDEPAGSAYALKANKPGCFCNNCMLAFNKFLQKQPKELLDNAGIHDLSHFNYRDYIKKYNIKPKNAPLWKEFVDFHLSENYRLLAELQEYARSIANQSVTMSLNASPINWIELPFMQLQDVIVLEVPHLVNELSVKNNSSLIYKLGDAYHKPVISTAHGIDWYQIKKGKHAILACAWIAQAYALGHYFMIPDPAWVMDPEIGSDSYYPEADYFLCLTTWIKSISKLLDGYKAIANVAVLVTTDAIKHDLKNIYKLASNLASENIPYKIIVINNNSIKTEIIAASLKDCSSIIIASPDHTSRYIKKKIDKLTGNRPVINNKIAQKISSVIQRPIRVINAEDILILPRKRKEDNSVVIHLLNQSYLSDLKKMDIKGPFQLIIKTSFLQSVNFKKAYLYQPVILNRYPEKYLGHREELQFSVNKNEIQITIPKLELWGIIELSI